MSNTKGWKYVRGRLVKPKSKQSVEMDTQGGSKLDYLAAHLMNK